MVNLSKARDFSNFQDHSNVRSIDRERNYQNRATGIDDAKLGRLLVKAVNMKPWHLRRFVYPHQVETNHATLQRGPVPYSILGEVHGLTLQQALVDMRVTECAVPCCFPTVSAGAHRFIGSF